MARRVRRIRFLLVASLALAAVPPAARSDDADAEESAWKLGVAFGYGQRTNPLIQSEDLDILVNIDVAWFGRRWFFDNGDVGFTLIDDPRFTFNFIGRVNSDRVFFSKTDTDHLALFSGFGETVIETIEVPDRDYAFELGAELLTDGDWGYLQLAAHRDASGRHDGAELYVNYGKPVRRNRWFVEPSFGVSFKSDRLNDYYWGVRAEESSLLLPAYSAGSGLNSHARFLASYHLDRHWTFLIAAHYERLSGAAASSPLVAERTVRGGFAGFSYRFF